MAALRVSGCRAPLLSLVSQFAVHDLWLCFFGTGAAVSLRGWARGWVGGPRSGWGHQGEAMSGWAAPNLSLQ